MRHETREIDDLCLVSHVSCHLVILSIKNTVFREIPGGVLLTVNVLAGNSWIVVRKANPWANLRLFCFPYSGAGASMFTKWVEKLPSTVELYAVQLPGRETRLVEPLFTRLPPLVEATAAALLPHLADKPFAFFGHSMGALLAFELARYLRRTQRAADGLQPVHLFVSGHTAPQLGQRKPPIHALPEAEFVAELRRYNGTPEEVLQHAELRQLLLPILRADFALYETYVYTPDPPLDCPISVFGGMQDEDVPQEGLEPWRGQTRAAFSLQMFPGDHFFVNSTQNHFLPTLAQQLERVANGVAVRSYL